MSTAAHGLMLDAEHADLAGKLLHRVKNDDAIALLSRWRRSRGEWPFCVVCGDLRRQGAGIVGGMAKDWPAARELFALASARLDEAAKQGGSFITCWELLLDEERCAQVLEWIAQHQVCEGTA